ncbi:hypothetical protein DFO70_106253 [Cytobacillus firmus]|uniref:Uncharacterized protein n=2 Tax=Cytobacillus TaxID=2675230 RepID=A0A366JWY2_CYTFI|nr:MULTISPECIES: hypothetical protein [Cytobacillus]RBP93121.1 hypothetical protein DFO70_106253 [Cytobacillus firmus]TDX42723.1 hypothetical protein DFO72_106253 [Cytobacillus oceanisediminis]
MHRSGDLNGVICKFGFLFAQGLCLFAGLPIDLQVLMLYLLILVLYLQSTY